MEDVSFKVYKWIPILTFQPYCPLDEGRKMCTEGYNTQY